MWQRKGGERRQRPPAAPAPLGVVDPGTTALRLLVVEIGDGPATVWGWSEGPAWGKAEPDPAAWVATCRDLLSRAEEIAQERAGRWLLPDQMLVGLPASQLRGRAGSVGQRRSRPARPVEEEELRALLGRALRLAVNQLSDPADPHWLLIEAAVVALTVDRRVVTDPVGFRGEEIGATVFAALAPAETVRAWGTVARDLEFSALILTAAPLALTAGLSEPQGVLVDVGGATTDLTWWRSGRPVALASLPLGGEAITDALIQRWRLAPNQAERLKRAYAGRRLADEAHAQVREAISPVLGAWLEGVEANLAQLARSQDELLPHRLYLLGGGSALPEMMDAARSLAWSRQLHFVRYPQVDRLQPTDLPGVVNRTDLGRQAGDGSALALAAWAAHQNRPLDRPARMLSEICQMEPVGR